jgi:hypothetical protein
MGLYEANISVNFRNRHIKLPDRDCEFQAIVIEARQIQSATFPRTPLSSQASFMLFNDQYPAPLTRRVESHMPQWFQTTRSGIQLAA